MNKRRISKLQLLQALRRLLVRPDTKVVRKKLHDHCGYSTWELNDDTKQPQNIKIYLDPRRDGPVSLVIHELLHVYMHTFLNIQSAMSVELEEAAVLAWEKALFSYLHVATREPLLESWMQAINRKIES